MKHRVLFVDDEPNVLESIRRNLRKYFEIETADGGDAALELLKTGDDFAVVVSDMRMPGMNGVELLSRVKVDWPDTVRIMLTGNADQATAVEAVNHGDIFRFLNKPCDPKRLAQVVASGIRQHQLLTAERDLLENTLRGSIKALAEILSLTNPAIFGRTQRFRSLMTQLAAQMNIEDAWQLESVTLLSQTGCVTLPEELVRRRTEGHPLPADDLREFAGHAAVGADLLKTIPRMEEISESIRFQERGFDGSGFPMDGPVGEAIPMGARLMKVIIDFDALESSGESTTEALAYLHQQSERYDPNVLKALQAIRDTASTEPPERVSISQLTDRTVLAEDVITIKGVLLVAKGQETTYSVRRHLQNFHGQQLIGDELLVHVTSE